MMTKLKTLLLTLTIMVSVSTTIAQDVTPEVTPEATSTAANPDQVAVQHEGLFPEGVEYDSVNGRFLVSSVAEGTVYAVADDGTATPFIQDDRIPSSTGLEVDEAGNRLLVAVTDLETQAFLGIYDLTSGENLAFIDFRPLLPTDSEHFANDVAVDGQGNAYVTDSLAGVIYKVDPQGNPTVWLEDETFSTQFALNGIAYDEAGNSLIAVRVPGLIKIPLDNPAAFTPVEMDTKISGEDGITFIGDNVLAAVSNDTGRVYRIESQDDFASAQATGMFETGLVNPTTVALRNGDPYVLYAHLNEDVNPITEFPIQKVNFSDMTSP
jgi:hypothetical protein